MIKWTRVQTHNGYPFKAYRTNKGYGNVILLKEATEELYNTNNPLRNKSLTNSIEEVLEHIVLGVSFGGENYKNMKFYQWCDEGLFEVIPWWVRKHTRDMPPIKLDKIEWKFISDNLEHFEVLYCD